MKKFSRTKHWFAGLSLACMLFAASATMLAQKGGEGADGGRQSTPVANSEAVKQKTESEDEQYRHSAIVQKLGKMFGMSTETAATTFEVVNAVILFALVGLFLAKALPKTFRERTSSIQKHLVDARTATEEASARMNSIEDRLAHLDIQINEMRAQAERDSAADELRIKASVEDERKKILASADQEIAAATLHAQRQLQQYAAELAIEQAARKLTISAETDRLLVQNFARRLSNEKGGEN